MSHLSVRFCSISGFLPFELEISYLLFKSSRAATVNLNYLNLRASEQKLSVRDGSPFSCGAAVFFHPDDCNPTAFGIIRAQCGVVASGQRS